MAMNILLLGKTGAGKSSLGNSILGHRAFLASPSTTSVTSESKKDGARLGDGRRIFVVDTPGVADTGYSEREGEQMFFSAITDALGMSPSGYHALLYVIKYGSRLTREDMNVTSYLKRVFGDHFLRMYGILVMTNGDNFKEDMEEEDMTLEEYCQQQGGLFAELYREVSGRVVVFDNTKLCPLRDKVRQRRELVSVIDTLAAPGHTYDQMDFFMARLQSLFRDMHVQRTSVEQRVRVVERRASPPPDDSCTIL